MRSHPLPWLLAVLSLLSGCSLLADFDPEGQLCNDGGTCLPGYVCNSRGVCVTPLGRSDGGTGGDEGTGGKSLCEDPAGCPEPPETR